MRSLEDWVLRVRWNLEGGEGEGVFFLGKDSCRSITVNRGRLISFFWLKDFYKGVWGEEVDLS